MCNFISVLFYLFILLRLTSFLISFLNEKKLKAAGAVPFSIKNTGYLISANVLYYLFGIVERYPSGIFTCDWVSVFGGSLMLVSLVFQFLVIFKGSKIIRYPENYLLMITELIGLSIFLHAPYSFFLGLPLYLLPLIIGNRKRTVINKQ